MNHELLKVQVEVLMSLIEAHPRHETYPRALATLGDVLGWDLGVLWAEREPDQLTPRAQWRSPRLATSVLEAETARAQLVRGRGLPAAVWDGAGPVWCPDVASEPDFARAGSAEADGLRGAVFVPLAVGDRVVGVIELHRRDEGAPDREVLEELARLGGALGIHLERVRARGELEDALRALDAELQERESKLAHEIHDLLGQELTGLKLDAAWVVRRLDASPIEPAALVERMEAMTRSIDGVLQTVRRIAMDLRVGVLDDLGLAAAIEARAGELAARAGLQLELELEEPPAVDRAIATVVLRAAQELLTNVVRHAGAHRTWISLREAGGMLELRVRDDGIGIDPAVIRSRSSLGLLGIRERALAYRGSFEIGPRDRGTDAVLRLPQLSPAGPR